MYIEIICLFAKSYLSADEFEELFLNNLNEFEVLLDETVYMNLISANWRSSTEIISLKNYIFDYFSNNYGDCLNRISDAYVDIIIESLRNDEVVNLLREKYKRQETVFLNLKNVNSTNDLIKRFKKAFNYPQMCGDNWDAVTDLIYDINFPQKIVLNNWKYIIERFPYDSEIITAISKK